MRKIIFIYVFVALMITGCNENGNNLYKPSNDQIETILKANDIEVGKILFVKETSHYYLVFHKVNKILYDTLFTKKFGLVANNYSLFDVENNFLYESGNIGQNENYRIHYLFGIVKNPQIDHIMLKDFHGTKTRSFTKDSLIIHNNNGIRFFYYFPPYEINKIEIHGTDNKGTYYTTNESI